MKNEFKNVGFDCGTAHLVSSYMPNEQESAQPEFAIQRNAFF